MPQGPRVSAGVLFDAPGPATRARHRTYGIVTAVALVALAAWVVYRLDATGQLEYDKWEPFLTPRYIEAILVDGLLVTLQLAFSAVIGALVFGVVFGVGKLSDHRWVRWPCWLVVEFFRAVPVIMLMIFCFFAIFGGVDELSRRTYWAVVTALTLYNGAVQAEVLRAGILAVPKGQSEAAYALGMSKTQVMTTVLVPQAVRSMLPTIVSQLVVTLKDTSLGFVITYEELLYAGRQMASTILVDGENPYVPVVLVFGAIYVALCLALSAFANWIERRGRRAKTGIQVADAQTAVPEGAGAGPAT